MTKYAQTTTVAVSASKAEIERIVERYGATGYMSGWSAEQAMIAAEIAAANDVAKRLKLRL